MEAVSMWIRRAEVRLEDRKGIVVTTLGIVFALGLSVQTFTQPGDGVSHYDASILYPFYMVVEHDR